MKKILMSLPILALMIASILAITITAISLRADDGTLNYVGEYNSFNFYDGHFSVYHRDAYSPKNGNQGAGALQIIAITTDGKRIVLSVSLHEKSIIEQSQDRLYVDNTATGIYWEKGILPKKVSFTSVRYDYNKITGLTNIAGEGDVNFRVTGMSTKVA